MLLAIAEGKQVKGYVIEGSYKLVHYYINGYGTYTSKTVLIGISVPFQPCQKEFVKAIEEKVREMYPGKLPSTIYIDESIFEDYEDDDCDEEENYFCDTKYI